jgi:hypothetical protein
MMVPIVGGPDLESIFVVHTKDIPGILICSFEKITAKIEMADWDSGALPLFFGQVC